MTRTEELRLGAFTAAWAQRDEEGRLSPAVVAEFVEVWRTAPLVEFEQELRRAGEAVPLIEAAVAIRIGELKAQRHRVLLLEARLVALGELR